MAMALISDLRNMTRPYGTEGLEHNKNIVIPRIGEATRSGCGAHTLVGFTRRGILIGVSICNLSCGSCVARVYYDFSHCGDK
jgi:hypothetical protein